MKAFLVQARQRRFEIGRTGLIIYVAAFETQSEAIEAVAAMLPPDEALELLLGTASPELIAAMRLKPGLVEVLA